MACIRGLAKYQRYDLWGGENTGLAQGDASIVVNSTGQTLDPGRTPSGQQQD